MLYSQTRHYVSAQKLYLGYLKYNFEIVIWNWNKQMKWLIHIEHSTHCCYSTVAAVRVAVVCVAILRVDLDAVVGYLIDDTNFVALEVIFDRLDFVEPTSKQYR